MNTETDSPENTSPPLDIRDLANNAVRDTRYLLPGLFVDTAKFSFLVTLVCVGVGTSVIWVGLPILVFTLSCAHRWANWELSRLRPLGLETPKLGPQESDSFAGMKWMTVLRTQRYWREFLHGIVVFPLTIATWSSVVTWWAGVLGGLTSFIWYSILDRVLTDNTDVVDLLHLPIPHTLFYTLFGLLFAVTLPWVVRRCCLAHIWLAKRFLLATDQELKAEIARLSRSREQLDAAEVLSRQRLEHDIHDGPQQKLIRLGMDLATAQRRLSEGDVETAGATLAEARTLTDATISELRALSRGFAPPILKDRGLDAALSSICAGSVVPARLIASLEGAETLPEPIASAAYFAVAEGLTNAAKHSGASEVLVNAQLDTSELTITVVDDGKGGAQVVPGHGLAGLLDRVEGHGGSMVVETVAAGGTKMTIKLPR
ncbi:MAG: sensor histidine kinase [Propionibacteriaceae bacterium]|jgi:signal transduction histidine kinase|nr:sensor histidine kinase [Propionibacteriaceae bacterium]